MTALVHQRCFEHTQREASSRCPRCKRYFCRECVVEHQGRITCTSCLKELAAKPDGRTRRVSVLYAMLGFLLAWFVFYELGRVLLLIPASFHEGVI